MENISLLVIALGIFLVFLHIYVKIDSGFDDRFWAKKSPEEILQERIKMNKEGKLNKFYQFDLYLRIFLSKNLLLKIGAILICIGITLNIIF